MKRTTRRLLLETLEIRSLLHGGGLEGDGLGGNPLSEQTWPEGEASPQTAFSLTDINPASATANQAVSPRDYLEQVSGWYFTHST